MAEMRNEVTEEPAGSGLIDAQAPEEIDSEEIVTRILNKVEVP